MEAEPLFKKNKLIPPLFYEIFRLRLVKIREEVVIGQRERSSYCQREKEFSFAKERRSSHLPKREGVLISQREEFSFAKENDSSSTNEKQRLLLVKFPQMILIS